MECCCSAGGCSVLKACVQCVWRYLDGCLFSDRMVLSILNVQAGLLSLCKKLNQKTVIYDLINGAFWNMLLRESLILKQSSNLWERKKTWTLWWSTVKHSLSFACGFTSRNTVCVIPEHQRVKRDAWRHSQSASTCAVLPTCCVTSPRGVVSGASVGRIDKGSYSLMMVENF